MKSESEKPGDWQGCTEAEQIPSKNGSIFIRMKAQVGFWIRRITNNYSLKVKLNAVNDYLQGDGFLLKIMGRYGIRSKKALQDWIKQYNTHGEISARTSGGGSYMSKSRQTTLEERLEIVQDCLANDNNYGAAALKYNCSYHRYATGYYVMRRRGSQTGRPAWKAYRRTACAHTGRRTTG